MKPVEPIGLLEGLATTRAIRRYTDEPIPDDDLATILWHAGRAPRGRTVNRSGSSSCVTDRGPALPSRCSVRPSATAGTPRREHDGYRPSRFADSMQRYVDRFEQTPVVVLVCLDRYRGASPYEGASVYPACQNLLLAARALGYGGALTMWHLGVEAELRVLLDIPDDVALSACITLGVPEGNHGPVRRKPIGEVVFDDTWGRSADWIST